MNAGADLFFVDTNVLLYALDARDIRKQVAARSWVDALWRRGAGRISWQVLHEFYANANRKIGVSETLARTAVETLAAWRPAEVTLGLLQQSWKWMDSAQISYWDSLILSAAERSGCRWLLSEDFQTGRKFEQVTVVNPFLRTPAEFGLASQMEGQ